MIISGQARIGGETNYNVWVWLVGLDNALKFEKICNLGNVAMICSKDNINVF